jgi:hypothetical protein
VVDDIYPAWNKLIWSKRGKVLLAWTCPATFTYSPMWRPINTRL